MTIEPRHPNSPAPTHPIAPTHQPGPKGPLHQPPQSPTTPPHRESPHREIPGPDLVPGVGKPFPGVVDPAPPPSPPVGPVIVR